MGFEKFFLTGEARAKKVEEEEEKIDPSRRSFLIGAAALAAAAALPQESMAQEEVLPEYEALTSPEAKERNIDKIFAYAAHLQLNEEKLRNAHSAKEIEAIIFDGIPALEEKALKDTELDFTHFMRQGGWPSLQFKKTKNGITYNSNTFSVNELVISNRHVFGEVEGCESSVDGYDISGCDFENTAVVPDDSTKALRTKRSLTWNPSVAEENLHGRITFIPSVHATSEGNEEVLVPAVLIRVTPNFLYQGKAGSFFGERDSRSFERELSESYIAVVAPLDADGNGVRNGWDVQSMSGSPVLTMEDCALGEKNVSGVVWGTLAREDERSNLTRSMIFIHGPKAIDQYLTQMGKNNVEKEPEEKSIAFLIEEEHKG